MTTQSKGGSFECLPDKQLHVATAPPAEQADHGATLNKLES